MQGNIILDGRRIKAMEILYALGEHTGKSKEYIANLWSELLKDEGLMAEFMYYLDNHTFKDDYKYKEYGLTDIYFYNLRVAEILETIADGKHQGILLSGRVLHIDLPAGKGFKAQRHPQAHIDGLASQSIGGHSIHRYSCRHFSRASS